MNALTYIAVSLALGVYLHFKFKEIIMNQEEFDAKITAANTALDNIATAITAETQQIIDYIASLPPNTDTSALDGVVTRLETVSTAIGGVFEPPIVP